MLSLYHKSVCDMYIFAINRNVFNNDSAQTTVTFYIYLYHNTHSNPKLRIQLKNYLICTLTPHTNLNLFVFQIMVGLPIDCNLYIYFTLGNGFVPNELLIK